MYYAVMGIKNPVGKKATYTCIATSNAKNKRWEGGRKMTSEVAEMQNTDLRNYSFTDMKVVFPKAGVAVVTYKARVDSSAAGQDTSGAYNAASVWTKRWGNWVLISHAFIKSQ